MKDRRGINKVLVREPEWETTWETKEDNIKMDLQEVGCGGMDWIEVT